MSLTFDEFKDRAAELLNINLDGYKIKRVKRRTDSLMRRHNIENYSECLELIQKDPDFKALYLGHFTINTSEFFRNPKNFEYLESDILPSLLGKKGKIKIWSAPCSNGSEPYTIAIILNEMGIKNSRYEILASDIDPDILKTARKGVYGQNSLKNVPERILNKYFQPANPNSGDYKLNRSIIKEVEFEEKDLIYDRYQKNWDLILSRNFFIYLTRELKDKLTEKFASVLNKGGYLFLGNTEFIFNVSKFGLKKEHLSFYRRV
ncbi:MAG: CheR family methyltransferase [Halanaerobiales bacterium]